jgi:N-acetylglucosamine-6-phosphate deacetylase
MIILSGADVVLPDRIVSPGTVAIDGELIVEVSAGARGNGADERIDVADHFIVPGFIDVHMHGVEGIDTLDDEQAVRTIAGRLPRFGVTAFCPTSIACSPAVLRRLLAAVRESRTNPVASAARVLPAHLESNFINPEFHGAQPLECLRLPRGPSTGDFTGAEILHEIAAARPDVGIITIAPELDGAIDLIADLVRNGHHVSLGHSGASYDEALAGIEAGARQATHLFNRMTPINHRQPGLAAAVLDREEIIAEVICDGVHVHPSMVRVALSAKQPSNVMAITDATAGAGMPKGSRAKIGGHSIDIDEVARLEDGTFAGSVLTMDRAFARLVTMMGVGLVDAATICATTPARALGLQGLGVISPGATADLVVLDRNLSVTRTFIAGKQVFAKTA